MSQKIRREQILQILKERGFVTVRQLTELLDYSSATVNRDLNAMQVLGLVKRSYGGVEAANEKNLPPLPQRQVYMKKEKRRLAAEAAKLIRDGDTLFLDGSTTVQYLCPFLSEKKELRVITNNMRLATELGEYDMDVICLGGRLCERPHVLYSEETVENAMRYCVDKMFFSVDQITANGYVNDGLYLLYRVMLKNSREAYLMTNRNKVVDRLEHTLCDFSALRGVISDIDFSDAVKELYPNVTFIDAK